MINALETKTLLMAVIKDADRILMRKKPAGSPPYKETWYLFGCEPDSNQKNEAILADYLEEALDIKTSSIKQIEEDVEIKKDIDGITKKFIYKDFKCIYQSGTPKIPQGAEDVRWIPVDKLSEYDIVPPTIKLLKKIHIL